MDLKRGIESKVKDAQAGGRVGRSGSFEVEERTVFLTLFLKRPCN
jgi:hypothetical protein